MSRNQTATNTQVTMRDSCTFTTTDLRRGRRATENCYTNRALPPLLRSRYVRQYRPLCHVEWIKKKSGKWDTGAVLSMGRSQWLWTAQISIYVMLFKSTVRYAGYFVLGDSTVRYAGYFLLGDKHRSDSLPFYCWGPSHTLIKTKTRALCTITLSQRQHRKHDQTKQQKRRSDN
jgi:hypothetical protein